jgi:hypothetical protein
MIAINIDKAKNIAHEKRRQARSAEFAPLDIKATIPSESVAAETSRQVVRDKYAEIQTAINGAETVDEIKNEMDKFSDKLNGI